MSAAALVLIIVVVASPVILLFDGAAMQALVAGAAAAGFAIVARTMRPGEASFYVAFARPAALLAAVPALWVLMQIIPLGVFAHPIWTSAQATLGHPVVGSISIDAGAGAQALGRYLTLAAVAFWTAAVAVDRQRAEHIMFALVAATAAIATAELAGTLLGLGGFGKAAAREPMQAADCIVIGLVVAGAAMVRTLERYETRRANPGRSVAILATTFAACAAAFAVSVGALPVVAPATIFLPVGLGLGTVLAIALVRRLGLGRWGVLALCVPAIAIAALLVAGNVGVAPRDTTLALATQTSEASATAAQRMLADAPFLGTGAGTFAAIASIYQDIDNATAFTAAPTAAMAAAIELGRPFLWFLVLAAGAAIVILVRGALRRGRDSFYPAAGAGTLIALLLMTFTNAGLSGTATATMAAATLGLAFAQCNSRLLSQ